jgi:hypothetical protein
MKKLFKRKKKTYTSVKDQFKVLIIDENSDEITTTLGITDERAQELFNLGKESYNKFDDITKFYVDICTQCNHINEVVFIIGAIHQYNRRTTSNLQIVDGGNIKNLLDDLQKRLRGNSDE